MESLISNDIDIDIIYDIGGKSIVMCKGHSPHERRFHRRSGGFGRRMFLTKQEKENLKEMKIKHIEQYQEFLQKELTGVNEYLEELKKD